MKTIYLVTQGEYSDYHIEGVFSTEQLAQAYIDRWETDSMEIEEWGVDSLEEEIKSPLNPFFVRIGRDGTVIETLMSKEWYSREEARLKTDGLDINNNMFCTVLALDEKHAVKIANERRAQRIAEGLWQ